MSGLGLVALVLAALVVAAAAILFRVVRRSTGAVDPGSPRTVADLVRMRAEQSATEPDGAAPVVAEPAVAEPVVETVVPDHAPAPAAAPPVPPVAESPPAEPAAAPEPLRAETPAVAQLVASDTPWGRAARMTEGDGAVWATGEVDHEWSEWADWADVDGTESGVPEQSGSRLRPVVLPAVSPELFGPRPVLVPAPADPAVVAEPAPVAAQLEIPSQTDTASDSDAATEESAVRRRTAAETAAEQTAADLALLRTFGCAPAGSAVPTVDDEEDDAPMLSAVVVPAAPAPTTGAAQTVAFRVVGRDGDGIDKAGVTLLDDRGRETTGAVADAKGRGEVRAPHPGSYVVVASAPGHQPGAVAITVAGEPAEAEVLLTRSASVAGTVFGEDGPIVGARLTLVQDGEIVDTTGTGPDGEYWISDLASGDYGLSVSAHDCEPAALVLTVPDETDLRHDVELVPVGLAAPAPAEGDVMIGHG